METSMNTYNICSSLTECHNRSIPEGVAVTIVSTLSPEEERFNKAADIIRAVFAVINILAGSVGNILTLIVMQRKSMRSTSAAVYFTILSFADTVFMVSGEGGFLIRKLFKEELIFLKNGYIPCNLMYFMHFTAGDYAIWMICAVTVDRYIAVVHPVKAKSFCKKTVVRIIYSSLLTVLCVKNLHIFFTRNKEWLLDKDDMNKSITGDCVYPNEGSRYFEEEARVWIAYTFLAILPSIIVLSLNIKIIRALRKLHSLRTGKKSTDRDSKPLDKKSPASKYLRQMTKMFLGVSFVFLSLVPLGYLSVFINVPEALSKKEFWSVLQSLLISMVYVNNASNFYVYCLTGRRFKKEVRDILCSWRLMDSSKADSTIGSSMQQQSPTRS